MVGTSRETVTRVVKGLKGQGWLRQEGKQYLVPRRRGSSEPGAGSLEPTPGYADVTRACRHRRDRFEEWILGSLTSGIVAIDARRPPGHAQRRRAAHPRLLARRIRGVARPRLPRSRCAAQPTVARLLLDALDGRSPLSRAELMLDGDARTAREHDRLHARAGARRATAACAARRCCSATSRPSNAATSRSACASAWPRSGRWPPAWRTRSAIRSRAWRCSPGCSSGASRTVPRRSRCSSSSWASCARWRTRSPRASNSCGRSRSARCPVDPRRARRGIAAHGDPARAVRRRDRAALCAGPARAARRSASCCAASLTNLIVNAFEAMHGQARPARLALCVHSRVSAPRRPRSVRVGAEAAPRRPSCRALREVVISVSRHGARHPRGAARKDLLSVLHHQGARLGRRASRWRRRSWPATAASLELESARGAGATFRVRLPVAGGGAS